MQRRENPIKPSRYTVLPLPAYRYVPGRAPHPTRDPDGHSYGKPHPTPAHFDVSRWQDSEDYLYGIDLFNEAYWWEAHESLEQVWVAAGRTTATGQFIQGLILIAVAQLKQHQGFTDVAQRMAAEGLDRMRQVRGEFLGIDMRALRPAVESFIDSPAQHTVYIKLHGLDHR